MDLGLPSDMVTFPECRTVGIICSNLRIISLLGGKIGEMLREHIYNVLHFILGFPCGSGGKESACNAGDLGSISGLGRCSEEGKSYPLQYSDLLYGVTKSWT